MRVQARRSWRHRSQDAGEFVGKHGIGHRLRCGVAASSRAHLLFVLEAEIAPDTTTNRYFVGNRMTHPQLEKPRKDSDSKTI